MTRVVVVNRDSAVAELEAGMLRAAGYEVEVCAGPTGDPCPVLRTLPCPLVDRADVLVYDAYAAGDASAGRQLIRDVRETYADLPVVLTSVDERIDWVELDGPGRVTPVAGIPTQHLLVAAIESALEDQGMAV